MRISDWSSDVCSSDLTARGCSGIGTLAPGSRICALRACPGRQDEEPESAPVSAFVERQTSTIACQPEFEGLMRPDPGSAPQTGYVQVSSMSTDRSAEHTSELQSLMRISYAVFCLKKKKKHKAQP